MTEFFCPAYSVDSRKVGLQSSGCVSSPLQHLLAAGHKYQYPASTCTSTCVTEYHQCLNDTRPNCSTSSSTTGAATTIPTLHPTLYIPTVGVCRTCPTFNTVCALSMAT
jgi:hypothetical protein